MKALKKILWVIAAVIFVVLGLIVLITSIFGEKLIKVGVETAATKTLGVGVSLKKVHLSILGGSVGIDGLVVNNPAGYQYKDLLDINSAKAAVNMGTLMKNIVHIKKITLDGTLLTIEQKGLTNNLQEILKSLPTAEKKEPTPAEEKPGKKLQIDELVISNTTVKAKLLPVPGKVDTVTIKLDTITMKNLGGDNKLDIGKLTAEVLIAMAKGVAKQGAGLLPDDMVNGMKATLDKTLDVGRSAVKEGSKVLEEGKGAAGSVFEGIKGIFGGKKTADPNKK